jgi:nucleoid-associated protein YgaU
MTRETKIGLLVGLAFIIVIGILLSDHLSSSNQPLPARLTDAGERARTAMTHPTGTAPPPVTLVGAQPIPPVAPVEPIPTPLELREPPVQFVQVGPAPIDPSGFVGHLPQPPIATPADSEQARTIQAIEQVALQHREPIVPVNPAPQQTRTPAPAQPTPAAQGMEYRAQPGDTLSRLAGRFMGGNTPANRDAIVRANPSLQTNPDLIVSGRLYIIPVPESAARPATATITPAPTLAPTPAPAQNAPQNLYVAREGDSLWKIAAEHLGDGSAWVQLKEINHETLRGGDVVRPGMKLRLQ